MDQRNMKAFDFAQGELEFKARLWKKLKTQMAMNSVQALEDDDLDMVNAAGMPVYRENRDDLI